jgi:cell division protein FtsI (penicillin-binding protein 3)
MHAPDPGASDAPRPAEPWRRRLLRSLLYGRNVDRAAKAKARIGLAILIFALGYAVITARLVMFAVAPDVHAGRRVGGHDAVATARPDILDRNGEILATDVRTPSLFGEPHRIIDVDEASELLTASVPELDAPELRERLGSKRRFVWLKREITPKQREQIHRLGLPGIGFLPENKRVYPNGAEVAHVIGHVNVDNQGIAGIEKWLDSRGLADLHMAGLAADRLQKPVELAVDLRVQHALRDELVAARGKFKAQAAAGLLTDVRTGEIIALVSVPDYDSNNPREALDPTRINRLTTGVFEMGSTFKALTVAMALDSGKITLKSSFDARFPLQYGKHTIHDFHAQNRVLTVPEIFTYSSNIGTARMALSLGVEHHKQFLRRLGQLDRLRTELPESAEPLVPRRWGELNTVTIAFGHGLSVAPLQAMMAFGALMNGGRLIPPTLLKRGEQEAMALATRVIKPETSDKMRYLMRLNVEKGTATRADVKGYYVGGKTGTSEKVVGGRYSKTKVLTAFTTVLPADQPRYALLIMLDEPQPLPETHGYATSGWNAVPVGGAVIARIAPLLGLEPRYDLPTADKLILASAPAR